MTQSRSKQVSLQDTRYYHLISRCVRRAYLCGVDSYSKKSFEHRRQWMVDRILDEKAVLVCMAYVDLNPIRAKMASSVNTAQYTSIFERIHDKASDGDDKSQLPFNIKPLLGFIGNEHENAPKGIAFSLLDYIKLVEETGKIIREDKRGYIDEQAFSLLQQLGIDSDDWLALAQHFGKQYHQAVGSLSELSAFAAHTQKQWISGYRQQASIFS